MSGELTWLIEMFLDKKFLLKFFLYKKCLNLKGSIPILNKNK